MTARLTNIGHRHGSSWFDFGSVILYAPPKTGSTTLHRHFRDQHRSYIPPVNRRIIGSWRNPVERWISAYNMLVVWGGKRMMKENFMLAQHGQAWFDTWMPNPATHPLRDPVGHARRFLKRAQPAIEQIGDELHFCSQSYCYARLFGNDWRDNANIELIPVDQWLSVIKRETGVDIREHGNPGTYVVPKHYYNTLYPALEEHFEEDLRIWNSIDINTV